MWVIIRNRSLGIRSGIFLGMVATAVVGLVSGQISPPDRLVGAVPGIGETFGVALTHFGELLSWDMAVVILTNRADPWLKVTRSGLMAMARLQSRT